ncbi:MAG: L-alanine-DL-glutamate epimerase, partial [Verrucomicrobiae bacterium]|nr:L-alanine-DL-glutamate epimerase [Verrucomicrobiae bacterium]
APFPGLATGLLETNGHQNYKNWETMRSYHPLPNASWTKIQKGLFHLDDEYWRQDGGIFLPSAHYEKMFAKT